MDQRIGTLKLPKTYPSENTREQTRTQKKISQRSIYKLVCLMTKVPPIKLRCSLNQRIVILENCPKPSEHTDGNRHNRRIYPPQGASIEAGLSLDWYKVKILLGRGKCDPGKLLPVQTYPDE